MMTLEAVNAMRKSEFVERFGGIYEHSPWVAEQVADLRPFSDVEQLSDRMREAVDAADDTEKLALIRSHPDLAGKLAVAGDLTEASRREQSGVGLDRLTEGEFGEFSSLNEAYRDRFGFPFIICVRKTDKAGILTSFRRRLENDGAEEFATAMREIHKIAGLRVGDLQIT